MTTSCLFNADHAQVVTAGGSAACSRDARKSSGLRRLWRSERGIAGLEAALIIPLMVFIIVGTLELYHYFRAAAILDRAAFTMADGVAMQRELFDGGACDNSDDICTYGAIAQDLLTPLDFSSHGWIIVSAFAATEPSSGSNPPPVSWKSGSEWNKRFAGSGTGGTAPDSLLEPSSGFPPANEGDTLIVVEVFYDFEPFALSSAFWEALAGQRRMYSRAFYRPRFAELRELS
ncbi:TadE/TadG family type IV pilus assembly protein [Pusillimonas sp.]|uniref:TadE/TadG family type IV pilus assembly protein n=1 Tax=Pusillimonas sp. TaxID=3040095 RepID=UPI0037CB8F54